MSSPKIVIHGAGLVGGFVGGALAYGGAEVTLLGRPRFLEALGQGLRLTDLDGLDAKVPRQRFAVATDPACLAAADLVLVCVKSAATEAAGRELDQHARAGTVVVSLQNGVHNAARLAAAAPRCRVVPGMVPFNLTQLGPAHWHRGTEGALAAAPTPAIDALDEPLRAGNLRLERHADMRAVLWAKVLLNLNNPINALSGVPLLDELADRDFRVVLSACMREGLSALRAAGIAPARLTRVRPGAIPTLLRLPTWAYARLALRTLRIDPAARSSMAEDLEAGRATEIDDINGAVLELAARHGVKAPVCQRVVDLVRAAERGGQRRYRSVELRRAVGL